MRHGALVLFLGLVVASLFPAGDRASLASAESQTPPTATQERQQRERDLRREVKKIQDELRGLNKEPAGVTKSVVPRSEVSDQPTKNLRESLESVPGVTVRQGQGGRDMTLSIRGSGR